MQAIRPSSSGYDAARAVWNAMHDRRPALIVRPRSAVEVAPGEARCGDERSEAVA
jgi:hypothetical protein